ncbi:MAG TPA: hypothetical protein PK680_10490, partial [Novosphingobium sp.]|nr:hypothetical protein [Novosphingobium sp.]
MSRPSPSVRLILAASAAIVPISWAAPAFAEDEAAPITVYGRSEGYGIDQTSTATKTDTPLAETPQSVTV